MAVFALLSTDCTFLSYKSNMSKCVLNLEKAREVRKSTYKNCICFCTTGSYMTLERIILSVLFSTFITGLQIKVTSKSILTYLQMNVCENNALLTKHRRTVKCVRTMWLFKLAFEVYLTPQSLHFYGSTFDYNINTIPIWILVVLRT